MTRILLLLHFPSNGFSLEIVISVLGPNKVTSRIEYPMSFSSGSQCLVVSVCGLNCRLQCSQDQVDESRGSKCILLRKQPVTSPLTDFMNSLFLWNNFDFKKNIPSTLSQFLKLRYLNFFAIKFNHALLRT